REVSAAGSVAEQRSAPCVWPLAEGRQRRDYGYADRRGSVEEAGSSGRMAAVDVLAEPYRLAGFVRQRSNYEDRRTAGALESHAQPPCDVGRFKGRRHGI